MSLAPLTTARLTIREFTLDDLEARHRLNNEAFKIDDSLETSREWLEWTVRNYRELEKMYQPPYGDYVIELTETRKLIGSVGLVPTIVPWGVFENPPDTRLLVTPEFGLFWSVFPEQWGKGYAPEAGRVVVDYLFEKMNIRRVVATTEHDNLNSQRVMEKLGMRLMKNPLDDPFWFEVVGILDHP